jgi:hypothetical protein
VHGSLLKQLGQGPGRVGLHVPRVVP